MPWDIILALASQQHNLVSRRQILTAGGTDAGIKAALRRARLTALRPGIFAVAGAAFELQPLMAACLAAGPAAAVSHLAAAHVWGAEQVIGGRLEITTFDNRDHRLPGVMTHRSRLDPAQAMTRYRGLPIVVPPLAVVQVAPTCHLHLVKSIANDLVKRGWTTFPAILEWLDLVGRQRREALGKLCLEAVEVGGHFDSPAARALCSDLTRAGAPPFETDYVVRTPGGLLRVDIAWPPPRIGIEYNGARDHGTDLARLNDTRRRNRLTAAGWRILDANRGIPHEEIIAWVLDALASAPNRRWIGTDRLRSAPTATD